MSTKTNFKRIALVAVAALGLGVLSSVPSTAAVSNITVSGANGTATTVTSDTSTGASVTVSSLIGQAPGDSVSVSVTLKSGPSTRGAGVYPKLVFIDSTVTSGNTGNVASTTTKTQAVAIDDSATATAPIWLTSNAANTYVGANFLAMLDTKTAVNGSLANQTLAAGTYVLTVIAQPYTNSTPAATGSFVLGTPVTFDVSIVVSATAAQLAAADTVASPVTSTAWLNTTTATDSTRDSSVAVAATSATTTHATIAVRLLNAAGSAAQESVTVTTDKGLVGTAAGVYGRSLTLVVPASGQLDILVRADGTSGVATINVASTSVTFTPKKVSFFSTTVTKITASKMLNTLAVGNNSQVILAVATDATNVASAADTVVYAYSSDTAVVSNYGTACAYDADFEGQICALTGVKAGTAKITLRNKSTVALSTVTSTDVIDVTVTAGTPASIKLAFDKATYAPGEKAYITVSVLDSAGKTVASQSAQNFLSSAGITSTVAFGNGSATDLATASIATAQRNVSAPLSVEPVKVYTVYMPSSGGTITISATGGSALPAAGQVKVTATATVTNDAAAALAAVTALATTVASLKTLITTLTNLVLKIQKKVKA